ncbi:9136_t:CDS:2 [Ambispora gerdemannii]|uniref:9136_t:CDS:1 n=1 Tax=Ambispora gerdemannii TaxID=144530 RepID=A0A9N8UXJ4_9GLOM|nr:9136_t:CDS:2 [Ambispora gerdemannii]
MSAELLSIINHTDNKNTRERETRKIKNLLIGATGSVASIKIPFLTKALLELDSNLSIKVCATTHALHFFDPITLNSETGVQVFTDQDEWKDWNKISDPILHIETCILRAWDSTRPVIVCPAMNTNMWNHPFTAKHLKVLDDELGYIVVPPISVGAMAEYMTIVNYVQENLI